MPLAAFPWFASGVACAYLLGPALVSFLGLFFAYFFFDFAPPYARQPGPQHSVKQINQEQHRRHPFIIHDGENQYETDNKKTRDRFFRLPIHRLEARILEPAEHHKGEKKHERRQNEFPVAEMMFAFGQPEQKKSDGCDEASS